MQSIVNLDQNVFYWFNSFVGINPVLDFIIKLLVVYLIYLVPILFVFFWFWHKNEKTQKFLLELFFVSVINWQVIARAIGMVINRARPSTFEGTREVLFHPQTYSFPSDHATFLVCITAYLYLSGYKKMGNVALIGTTIISISRVIAGFHFPGDVVAGWILGVLLAFLFNKIRKYIEKYFADPLYNLAKKLKLA